LDAQANADDPSSDKIISTPDSKVAVVIIPTNEEYMIAKQTRQLIMN
jgi:acetate kinase